MTTPLPALLRQADEYLSSMTDPTGRTASRDNARAELRDASGDVLAEYLEWDDALGVAMLPGIISEFLDHPALAPALAKAPESDPCLRH